MKLSEKLAVRRAGKCYDMNKEFGVDENHSLINANYVAGYVEGKIDSTVKTTGVVITSALVYLGLTILDTYIIRKPKESHD